MYALYCCTNEDNTCPKREECKRYALASDRNNCSTTLFKTACTENNGHVLFTQKETEKEENVSSDRQDGERQDNNC